MFSVSVRRLPGVIVVMGLALFSFSAEANTPCGSGSWYASLASSCNASMGAAEASMLAAKNSVGGVGCDTFGPPVAPGTAHIVSGPTYAAVGPPINEHQWNFSLACSRSDNGADILVSSNNIRLNNDGNECASGDEFDSATGQCVSPTECDGSITGESLWRPAYSAGLDGTVCHEASQCKMTAVDRTQLSDTAALVRYVGSSEGCTTEPPAPPTSAATQCISQGGNTWCTEPGLADENCGYYNAEFLCLAAIPPGNCTFFGNGDMACDSAATAPPAPDDGVTQGNRAMPDGGLAVNDGTSTTDIDIFNNTTVNNSLGGVSGGHPGSGSGPGQGGDGPGDINVEIDFDPIIEEGTDPSGPDDIDQNVADLDALFDEIELEMGEGDSFAQPTVGLDDSIANVLTGSTCADIVLPSSQYMPAVTFPCSELSDLRAVLGWVLRIVLAMQFFNMITTRPGS